MSGNIKEVDFPVDRPPSTLPNWWDGFRKTHDTYVCYAVILTLPNDKEVIDYVQDYAIELDIISGDDCLVMMFRKEGSSSIPGYHKGKFNVRDWKNIVKKHVHGGYSAILARIFGIEFKDFPCLLLFKEINTTEYTIVSLKGMTSDEIKDVMRSIFTIIASASANSINPIIALNRKKRTKAIGQGGKNIISAVKGVASKTLEAAMEAWINTMLKP